MLVLIECHAAGSFLSKQKSACIVKAPNTYGMYVQITGQNVIPRLLRRREASPRSVKCDVVAVVCMSAVHWVSWSRVGIVETEVGMCALNVMQQAHYC